jgi:hypothetical protein
MRRLREIAMPRRLELTARLRDLSTARDTARRLTTGYREPREQHETHFRFSHGLLKLRETVGRPAELIWYTSAPYSLATINDYAIVEVPRRSRIESLKRQLSIRAIVTRRRETFFRSGMQIHFDEVSGRDPLLHFEIVLGDYCDERTASDQLSQLKAEFNLAAADLLPPEKFETSPNPRPLGHRQFQL